MPTFDHRSPRPGACSPSDSTTISRADEANMKVPEAPLIFTKFPSCLAGPTDPVVLGGSTDDYEAELVVVIGQGGRHIKREDAWGHVGGLTVGQDISDRVLQFAANPPISIWASLGTLTDRSVRSSSPPTRSPTLVDLCDHL